MGLIEFLILAIIVVFLCWAAIWIAEKLSPGHPKIVDYIIWALGIFIIVYTLANALGLLGLDPRIPRIR